MKNRHAVALGRLGGRKGGPARAASLSPERRLEISVRAAEVRWRRSRLPDLLGPLFWEHEFSALRWPRDKNLVVGKVLACGDTDQIDWLRGVEGDGGIAAWIRARRGRGLDSRTMARWIPSDEVQAWLAEDPNLRLWDSR